jgi:hypothetical protein
MKPITSYIGLDVHKSTVSVAIAEDGRCGEVRHYGVVENRADVMIKLGRGWDAAASGCISAMRRARVGMAFTGC